MKSPQYYYIYNRNQANWMLKQGLIPLEIGQGSLNDIYLKFRRDESAATILKQWQLRDYKQSQ